MISCEEAVGQLWEVLDDSLSTEDRRRLEAHLALCRRCCGEAEFTGALRDMLQTSARPHIPAEVESDLVAFLDTIEQELA